MVESEGDGDSTSDGEVERTFTCTVCGFGVERDVAPLEAETRETCLNCGEWAVFTADESDLVDAAREAAAELAGLVVTEKQAIAYLLRERVGLDRTATAERLDSSASNVDNLHRRGREKIEAARRVVGTLDALDGSGTDESAEE
jgi:hypothetical protein